MTEPRENKRTPAAAPPGPAHRLTPAKILIVGGDPEFRAALATRLRTRRHRCTHVNRLDEARSAIAQQRYDLILLNPALPDGDGLDLARRVQIVQVSTKTIVFSDADSFRIALGAMRCGAVDFIRMPAKLEEFVERVDVALARSISEKQREERIRRLHRLCRDLHEARDEISDHVDLLCNDLLVAYRDMNNQITEATMASEFRTLLRQELDIEDALRTTLEYLLSKTGPTNAAVFLPDPGHRFSLGAYVNYDCPRASIDEFLDHLCEAICPQMSQEPDLVSFDDAAEFAEWIGADRSILADAQVLAFSCIHEGECLAVVVLFRGREQPLSPDLAATLDIMRSIFAEQLSRIIRVHHRAAPEWPPDADDDGLDYDDFGFGFGGGVAA